MLTDDAANALMTEWAARKIRQQVKDPAIAEKLIPANHGFGTRRLPLETGSYEIYNQPHVRLVDINETPIERITEAGLRTSAEDFAFDVLIYAAGFDGVTGPYHRIDIRGPCGRSLRADWVETPRTFLGVLAEGFPNMLMVPGPHTARGSIEDFIDWTTRLVKHMRNHKLGRVEARPESVARWDEPVGRAATGLLFSQANSWQTGVKRNVEGRQVRRTLGYYGGAVKYCQIGHAVAAGGYAELHFR